MTAPARLAAFGLASLIAVGGGAAVGAAVGPAPSPTPTKDSMHEESTMTSTTLTATDHANHRSTAAASEFRIATDVTVVAPGEPRPLHFAVLGPGGAPVTEFDVRHDRLMHLIVVSNDLTTYAHLHPELGLAGALTVDLPALSPGGYRLIADAVPTGGPDLVLAFDVVVPGAARGAALPAPSETVTVGNLTVDLVLSPIAGAVTAEFGVRRSGRIIEPDPYLGARGHLVAIDAGDLGYLHVHPDENAASGPVSFTIAAPAPGRYRLFFDFSVGGQVRTAAFTVDLTSSASSPAAVPTGHAHTSEEAHS